MKNETENETIKEIEKKKAFRENLTGCLFVIAIGIIIYSYYVENWLGTIIRYLVKPVFSGLEWLIKLIF